MSCYWLSCPVFYIRSFIFVILCLGQLIWCPVMSCSLLRPVISCFFWCLVVSCSLWCPIISCSLSFPALYDVLSFPALYDVLSCPALGFTVSVVSTYLKTKQKVINIILWNDRAVLNFFSFSHFPLRKNWTCVMFNKCNS